MSHRWACAALLAGALLEAAMSGCSPAPHVTVTPTLAPVPVAAAPATGDYLGEVVEPPVTLRDFALPSSSGETLHLSDLDGAWRVIFFGYLHCPDFCPMTLTAYKRVKQLLGAQAESVRFVYISVDGARDTPEALRQYLDNFDPAFIGLSGDDETLARIQPDFGFYYRRRLDSGSSAVYVIDHSTRTYLVDPAGRLRATFTYDIPPAQVAAAVGAWVGG